MSDQEGDVECDSTQGRKTPVSGTTDLCVT